LRRQEMQSINIAIVLAMLILPAHAEEQNATVQNDTVPIENPPLPRPRPLSLDVTGDNPAVLISTFRHQHGEGSVAISAALTGIAQEQAKCHGDARLARSQCTGPVFKPDRSQRLQPRG
jgi:hypothetical protein